MAPRYNYDVCLAGLGMGDCKNTTVQTMELLDRARVVFSLSARVPWLRRRRPDVIDLRREYYTGEEDLRVYSRLAERVLEEGARGRGVLFVDDGHPLFYDDISEMIVKRGRRRGLVIRVDPAISSLDVMMSHLGVRIAEDGFQAVEASALVVDRQRLNPRFDTLVMQVGFFGTIHIVEAETQERDRLKPLQDYLRKFYPPGHRVRILRNAVLGDERNSVFSCRLDRLSSHSRRISVDATLHIPRIKD